MSRLNVKILLVQIIFWIICPCLMRHAVSQNAPVSTAGSVVSLGSAATVSITAVNFNNIGSFNLKLIYDPALVLATTLTAGPLLGGFFSPDVTVPGIISMGWFTFPGKTLPANSVIFDIVFTKIAPGTSAITWEDDGFSCVWYDGNWNALNDVPISSYYINGAVTFPPPLISDFTAANTTPPKNTTVQFTDLTTGNPASWDWSFDRTSVTYVNGTNAHSQNPQVMFSDGGLYTVTLLTHNIYFNDTKIKASYIRAGVQGLWTGSASTDWNASTNWDNFLVPDGSSDVIIPSSATYWPLFDGNLTIGTDCKNLTLNGATSRLTVSGNLTIKP